MATHAAHRKGATVKSARQVRFLLSAGSPLSIGKKAELKRELHTGQVKVGGARKAKAK